MKIDYLAELWVGLFSWISPACIFILENGSHIWAKAEIQEARLAYYI